MMNEFQKSDLSEEKIQRHYGFNNSLNLFERILRQNRRISSCGSDTFVTNHDHLRNEGKETLNERVDAINTQKIVDSLADEEIPISQTLNESVDDKNTQKILDSLKDGEIPLSDRLKMLNCLIEERSADRTLSCDKLISFSAELCRIYCSPKSSRSEELKIFLPFLKALRKFDSGIGVLSQNSNFVYDLMRACSTCVTTYLSKSKELRKITQKKTLAGRVKSLEGRNFFRELSRSLGVPDATKASETESIKGIFAAENMLLYLFDTTKANVEKDINKHIAEMNLPEFPDLNDKSEVLDNTSGGENSIFVNKEEWTDVEIARVLPFGEILAYTKKDWRNWLNLIDGEMIQFMKFFNGDKAVPVIETGTAVGFWTADARFPGYQPKVETRCLRGIALGKAPFDLIEGENVSWAVWAVDIGMLTFCSKLLPLHKALLNYEPLISLCSLDLEIRDPGKNEREFLLAALPLLTELLAYKPSAAKHIIAHDAGNFYAEEDKISSMDLLCVGGAFLMLIEYPDQAVRLEFLKLMLSLARNSVEVLRYLVEFKFYLAVSTRLEICAHFCEAATADSTFWMELRILLQVLTAILYECEKYTNELPGMSYMQKVLIMLTNIEPYNMKFMAAKCHAILVNFKCDLPSAKDSVGEKIVRRKATQNTNRVKDKSVLNKTSSDIQTGRKTKDILISNTLENTQTSSVGAVLSVMELKDSDEDDSHSSDLPSANAAFDTKVNADFCTKGSQISIRNSNTVELSPETTAFQISETNLAKNVCSFLNNGFGGTIYYGINANGTIEGIRLNRLERDTFRKGVDRMMARSIYPEVRPACYDIRYIPVTRAGGKIVTLSAHRTWVVEIQLRALPHVVYTMSSNRKCFVRKGKRCIEGTALTMRQDAAELTKKEILKEIQEFKAQIPDTKEKLVMFVKDYLEKTYSEKFDSA